MIEFFLLFDYCRQYQLLDVTRTTCQLDDHKPCFTLLLKNRLFVCFQLNSKVYYEIKFVKAFNFKETVPRLTVGKLHLPGAYEFHTEPNHKKPKLQVTDAFHTLVYPMYYVVRGLVFENTNPCPFPSKFENLFICQKIKFLS
jgi:hypothetical protein